MNERKKVNLVGPVRRWMLTVALVAGVVLLFSAPSGAQSTPEMSTPSAAKVVAPPLEQASPAVAAQSRTNGKTEGIKVHGHWMIEVRNPDGTVVTHREFENSLIPRGAYLLASILGRQNTVSLWLLTLGSTTTGTPQPCVTTTGIQTSCTIFEPAWAGTAAAGTYFTNLSVSVSNAGSLVLSGTAVAGQNGTIDQVQSIDYVCAASVSPATCYSNNTTSIVASYTFTQATVTPAVNVSYGQTVAVTVTFTFA
jgi:hypothetical protein